MRLSCPVSVGCLPHRRPSCSGADLRRDVLLLWHFFLRGNTTLPHRVREGAQAQAGHAHDGHAGTHTHTLTLTHTRTRIRTLTHITAHHMHMLILYKTHTNTCNNNSLIPHLTPALKGAAYWLSWFLVHSLALSFFTTLLLLAGGYLLRFQFFIATDFSVRAAYGCRRVCCFNS